MMLKRPCYNNPNMTDQSCKIKIFGKRILLSWLCVLIFSSVVLAESSPDDSSNSESVTSGVASQKGDSSQVEGTDPRGDALPFENTPEASASLKSNDQVMSPEDRVEIPTPKNVPAKKKYGYTVNLKELIKKSRDNIKEVNKKIHEQEVKRRNQLREEKARLYFEKANQLFEEGKFREAQLEWEKAIKITSHPEMSDYIRQSPDRFSRQETALRKEETLHRQQEEQSEEGRNREIKKSYDEGVSLYKQKKYRAAKEEFLSVEELLPEHKATRSYLKIIEQELIIQKDKEAQEELERKRKEEELARQQEKEEWQRHIEEKERERELVVKGEAEANYSKAIVLFESSNYVQAKEKFQEVEWIVPNYKLTQKYLKDTDQSIKKQEKRIIEERQKELDEKKAQEDLAQKKQLEDRKKQLDTEQRARIRELTDVVYPIYGDAVILFKQNKFAEAKEKFVQVSGMLPDFKATKDYLAQINLKLNADKIREEEAKREEEERIALEEKKKKESEADGLYAQALEMYGAKKYEDARGKFEAVKNLIPDFKSIGNYLGRIDGDMAAENARQAKLKQEEDARKQKEAEMARLKAEDEKRKEDARKQKEAQLAQIKAEEDKKKEEARQAAETKRKLETDADGLYQEALALHQAKKFEDARGKFEAVKNLIPEYKSTDKYLSGIEGDMAAENARQAKLKQEEDARQQKEEELARIKAQEDKKREEAQQAAAAKKKLETDAEAIYQQGLAFYHIKKFEEARGKFEEVQKMIPVYKATVMYLSRIDHDIAEESAWQEQLRKDEDVRKQKGAELTRIKVEKDQKKEEARLALEAKKRLENDADALYQEALDLHQTKKFEEARGKFEAVNQLIPDYKLTAKYLSGLDGDIAAQKARQEELRQQQEARQQKEVELSRIKEKHVQKKDEKNTQEAEARPQAKDIQPKLSEEDAIKQMNHAETIYTQATELYRTKKFLEAKNRFLEVAKVLPDYKATQDYLKKVDRELSREEERAQQESMKDLVQQMRVERMEQENVQGEKTAFESLKSSLKEKTSRGEKKDKDLELKSDGIYREALGLYKAKKYAEAKDKFRELDLINPGYQSTATYLSRIDRDIHAASAQQEKLAKKQQERQQKSDEQASLKEEESQNKKLSKNQDELKRKIDQQAETTYQEGQALYSEKKYEEARGKFEEVRMISPDYKSTMMYLKKIDLNIDTTLTQKQKAIEEDELRQKKAKELAQIKADEEIKKKKDEHLDFIYREAMALFLDKKYEEARQKFSEVKTMNADYKLTLAYLGKIDQAIETDLTLREKSRQQEEIRQKKAQEFSKAKAEEEKQAELARQKQEILKKLEIEAEAVYSEAIRLYKDKQYEESRLKFEEVEKIKPDYKSTALYLAQLERDIKKELSRQDLMQQVKEIQEQKAQELAQSSAVELQEASLNNIATIYQSAISLYREKKYPESKARFEQVKALNPDYKLTALYLGRIERKELAAQEEEQTTVSGDQIVQNTNEEETLRLARQKQEEQAAVLYQEGVRLYLNKQYAQARSKFVEIRKINSEYKSISLYLSQIDRDIEQELQQMEKSHQQEDQRKQKMEELARIKEEEIKRKEFNAQVESSYDKAIKLYNAKQFSNAQEAFAALQKIAPTYKRTDDYLSRIEENLSKEEERKNKQKQDDLARQLKQDEFAKIEQEKQAKLEEQNKKEREQLQERQRQQQQKEQIVPLYREAVALYKEKNLTESKKRFIELDAIAKDYKDTAVYLAKIEKQIIHEDEHSRQKHLQAEEENQLAQQKEFEESIRLEKRASSKETPAVVSASEKQNQQLLINQAEGLYQKALDLYNAKEYEHAQATFKEFEKLLANNQFPETYLKKMNAKIRAKQESIRNEQNQAEKRAAKEKQKQDLLAQKREEKERALRERVEEMNRKREAKRSQEEKKREEVANVAKNEKSAASNKEMAQSNALEQITEEKLKKEDRLALRNQKQDERLLKFMAKQKEAQKLKRSPSKAAAGSSRVDADLLYRDALKLYKEQKYAEAKGIFRAIDVMSPDYKLTRNYIERIEKKLTAPIAQNNASATETFQYLAQAEMAKAKDEEKKLIAHMEEEKKQVSAIEPTQYIQDKNQSLLESMYFEAVNLYEGKMYKAAKEKFLEVAQRDPDYKMTALYLTKVDEDIKREKERTLNEKAELEKRLAQERKWQLERQRQQEELAQLRAQKEQERRIKEEKIRKEKAIRSLERDTLVSLQRNAKQSKQNGPDDFLSSDRTGLSSKIEKERLQNAETLYKQGLRFFSLSDFITARDKFAAIEEIMPNFKRTRYYLSEIARYLN